MNSPQNSMVMHPHDENRKKAGNESEVARPLGGQRPKQTFHARLFNVRHLQFQSEQCNRDREHTVAECLKPASLFFLGRTLAQPDILDGMACKPVMHSPAGAAA